MKFNKQTFILGLLCVGLSGCATMCKEQVPPGFVGMCRTVDGFGDNTLPAGWHECWGSDASMHYLEVSDQEHVIHMSVLCQDSLNFQFDVAVLASADRSNKALMLEMFENITPENGDTISSEQIFNMYARSVVDQEARKVVSKYDTSEIVTKRPQIIEEILSSVNQSLKGTIVEVKRVTVNNLDFPAVVTQAQEEKAQRKVEIETEKAEQEKRLLKAQNALKISALQYEQQLLEASMISDANQIIGQSISPEYLAWWQLKVMGEAAAGPNNWGFIPYTDFNSGMASNSANWTSGKRVIDEELRQKIREVRVKAEEGAVAQDTGAEESKNK